MFLQNNVTNYFGLTIAIYREHTVIKLIYQTNSNFENKEPKAFDIVEHKKLISKLKNYGVIGKNLHWFQRPLLFLIHVNNLSRTSDNLEPVMYADDIKL